MGDLGVEGEALLLQKWCSGMTRDDFANTQINNFVQLYRLPFELRNDDSAREIVEKIGYIKDHKDNGKTKETNQGREYLRYRIEIDVTRPIIPGFFLERIGKELTWISLKYEKLPILCFKCGVLTHDTRSCKVSSKTTNKDFGIWLKAEERNEYVPKSSKYSSGGSRKLVVRRKSIPRNPTFQILKRCDRLLKEVTKRKTCYLHKIRNDKFFKILLHAGMINSKIRERRSLL